MDRVTALILTIIFFVLFTLITYYGAQVELWSAIIFGLFVALILLNIFYPPSRTTEDPADFSLVIYAAFEIVGILLLAIYIAQRTLSDVRTPDNECNLNDTCDLDEVRTP
jgi:uncharacterized membrane protein YagU involved in acid resistance